MGRLILNEIEYSGTDGGVELTYAEYLALPEPAKHNGTTYYITDVNDDENGFQPVIYSEDEREIGVWVDGKPLYQKSVNIGKITQTGERTYTIGIKNVDTIVAYSIIPLERSGEDGLYAIDNYNVLWGSGSYTAFTFKKDSTAGLQIIVYSGYYTSTNDIYVTVRYTKTTDAPGSGTWTPQGVPAVHYSTDEKVVGTWIDGSTIYEKTLAITGGFSSDMTVQHGITNIGEWIKLDGIVRNGTHSAQPINDPVSATAGISGYNLRTADLTSSDLSIHIDAQRLSQVVGIYITVQYTKTS